MVSPERRFPHQPPEEVTEHAGCYGESPCVPLSTEVGVQQLPWRRGRDAWQTREMWLCLAFPSRGADASHQPQEWDSLLTGYKCGSLESPPRTV